MEISRRAFLGEAAGSIATRAAESGRWNMRLSTSSVMFNSLHLEEACRRIAAAGYNGVDLWQGERFRADHLEEALRLGPGGLTTLLARNLLKLCSFTRFFDGIEPYAGMLGTAGGGEGLFIRESRYYGTASGASGGATRPRDIRDLGEQIRSLLESLKPQLELADRHNFQIAIENHSSAILNSLDSFKIFLDLASHPRLWIALAPYHLLRDGIAVEEVIRVAGKRMRFFYAWQNEPEIKQLPGFGSTNFTPWLEALAAADYRGYINPFMHENLRAAAGENRQGLSPDEMSKAIVTARGYLEKCREKF